MNTYSIELNTDGKLRRPVFLIGMPRSGTTVMADILAYHEDLFWLSNYQNRFSGFPASSIVNRLHDLEFVGVQLGKMRNKAKGWRRISKLLPSQSEAHLIWARYCSPAFPDSYMLGKQASQNERDAFHAFLCRVGRAHGKLRFFHKFTGPARIGYLHSIFPDAVFINLVRDPRAVIASLLKSDFWLRGGGADRLWWNGSGIDTKVLAKSHGSDLLPVALAASQWDRVSAYTLEEAAQHIAPNQILNIRYEDFTDNPRGVTQRVLDTSGLPNARRIDDFIDKLSIRSDMNEKFRSQFNEAEIETISALTANTAAKFGYEF